MTELLEAFWDLPVPKSGNQFIFSAVPIPDYPNHRIAKDRQGNPCFLISTSGNEREIIPNQRLYNLAIHYNLQCEILQEATSNRGSFSVILYTGNDQTLIEHFLSLCRLFLVSLGHNPTNEKVGEITNKFVDLFRNINQPPQKSIQGLWSELFVINESSNPSKLVKAWHSIPEERYDFSFDNTRVEVKSSGNRIRAHHFSFEQLSPPQNCKLFIVSLFAEIVSGGVSVLGLIQDLESKLSDIHLIEKLKTLTFSTLGRDLNRIDDIRFDAVLARESLKVFDWRVIPRIEEVPSSVYDVHFKSSLEGLTPAVIRIDEF